MTNQIVKANENETNRLLTSQENAQMMPTRFSPAQVLEQMNAIQEMMKNAMKDGEHYGKIPGCGDKPSLLKPGAEKLAVMFRLAPNYEIRKQELPNNHREYEILCTLHHINSQQLWGGGIGCATTMESKYRYRWDSTGRQVPKEYWDSRDRRDPELLGGPQFKARKVAKEWLIFQYKEHDNPADYYNTVLKMAKKRAFVDAILTATAASDCFTQDVEEMAENGVNGKNEEKNNKTDIRNYQSYQKNTAKTSSATKSRYDFPTLVTKVEELVKIGKITADQMHSWLKKANVESIDDLKLEALQAIVDKYEMPDVPF